MLLRKENQASELWAATLGALEVQVTSSVYEAYLKESYGLEFHGEEFVIGVDSPFVREMLEKRMYSLLERTLSKILKQKVNLTIKVGGAPGAQEDKKQEKKRSRTSPPDIGSIVQNANPRYTFNSFVIGENNEMAYNAALAVSQSPAELYNPLYIHSDVGLGKTHLLQAIRQSASAHGLSTLFVSSEQFVSDFVTSVRGQSSNNFRDKYRSPDILLVDDIQFLSGKAQSEESFFHVFNSLHDANRQIIVTSDCPPEELRKVQSRLVSRLQWGLEVEVSMPSEQTRFAILKEKSSKMPVKIGDDILSLIASLPVTSVRALEGNLNKVVAFANIKKGSLTLDSCKNILKTRASTEQDMLGQSHGNRLKLMEKALEMVGNYYGVSVDVLKGSSRERRSARARQIAMYLIYESSDFASSEIGEFLGNRHAKTIQYGIAKINSSYESDDQFHLEIDHLKSILVEN
jgi:chromosomal replication initiator protein